MFKETKIITLKAAKLMGEKALEKSEELNKSFVFSVVDAGGHIIYVQRMEDSFITSIDISINKAFTAATMKRTTELLTDKIKPESELFGLNNTNNGKIIPFGGGLPIIVEGKVIGGIGVSGGKVSEDIEVAKNALKALEI